jgi:hypothetical protein
MSLPWKPIENAPKDRAVILFYLDCYGHQVVSVGSWCEGYEEAYWFCENNNIILSDLKNMWPTHYCEIVYPEDFVG